MAGENPPLGFDEAGLARDASSVRSPRLRQLVNIWCRARTGVETPPAKADIDPVDLGTAGLLPSTWLVERIDEGEFIYRLAGEDINMVFGRSLAGHTVFDLFELDAARMVVARWVRLLTEDLMSLTVGDIYSESGRVYYGERIVLPLLDSDDRRRFLIGATDYRLLSRGEDVDRELAAYGDRHRSFIEISRVMPLAPNGN